MNYVLSAKCRLNEWVVEEGVLLSKKEFYFIGGRKEKKERRSGDEKRTR